jgi:hypothetical protein
MNAQATPSRAEIADRTIQLLAGSMFALALIFAMSVAEFFASESAAAVIDIFVKILGVTVLALMGLLYYWKFRPMTSGQRRHYLSEDGFLQIGFRKAMARSWMLSFLVLVILQVLDEQILERLPAMPLEIAVKAVLALMLLLFSLAFVFVTRPGSSDE